MQIYIHGDGDAAALAGAKFIAGEARAAVKSKGRFAMAVSGGHVPWQMFRLLADELIPWKFVHVFQVDERLAPDGDTDRNLTHLRESLLSRVPLPAAQFHAMPVEEGDLEAAAASYARILQKTAGLAPRLDLVHLGLGPDGHTASLVPNDPVLDIMDRDVALTQPYQNRRRMTLTYPILNRARRILWLVCGHDKSQMLARLKMANAGIPAGRVRNDEAVILADSAAAEEIRTFDMEGALCE